MKNPLPPAYDPSPIEKKWYAFWEERGCFTANPRSGKPPYALVIPPPNVTGVLHMGHALVNTLQDLLIRWKRMSGYEALWVPGTDHAGISTQTAVENALFAKTKKRRTDFPREEFVKHIWDWKEKSQETILSQIKQLGCSCDWSKLRFTLDSTCSRAVRTCFKKMYDDGWIYQGDYLVNWDPITQTAISDDEVEHEETQSFLWHIRYPLESGDESLTIATTRPETLLGDTAVAVHPKDPRYTHLIGRKIRLPLSQRLIPIIADSFVDPEFGTGVVKITPAHDFADFEVGLRHNLPRINLLTPEAKLNEHGLQWEGMSVEQARESIIEELKKQNLLVQQEPHRLRIGRSYRSKAIVQPYLSKQWFVKMSAFKEELLSVVRNQEVRLIPEHWEPVYFHWIENLRDWCISRQLWWGHQIPIWSHREDPTRIICYGEEGIPPEVQKDPENWIQDPDVLDTWFSSALWPLSVFGWPEETEELKTFYPVATLITAHDILFFWVARMLLMGKYITKQVPFRETFLHGLIYGRSYWRVSKEGWISYVTGEEKRKYDLGEPLPKEVCSKWEKMSKTKGNVIDPLEIIREYGADATRFALCSSVTHARQIDLDRRRFEEHRHFINKIWNASRFVLPHLESLSQESLEEGIDESLLALEDHWILSVYERTLRDIDQCFTEYTFDKAALRIYDFFWNEFCAIYLELAKPILFGKTGSEPLKKNKQQLLAVLLCGAIRMIHPLCPFVTEEIFSRFLQLLPSLQDRPMQNPYLEELRLALKAPDCIRAPYPKAIEPDRINPQVEEQFLWVYQIVRTIRNLRAEMQVPQGEKTTLYLYAKEESQEGTLLQKHQEILQALTPTHEIFFVPKLPHLFGASTLVGSVHLLIPLPETLRIQEKTRLEKEQNKLEKLLESTSMKLQNSEFLEKAPPHIVQKLQETLSQTEKQLLEIQEKLKTF